MLTDWVAYLRRKREMRNEEDVSWVKSFKKRKVQPVRESDEDP